MFSYADRRRRKLVFALAAAILAWLLLVFVIGPWAIRLAHAGRGPSYLVAALEGRHLHPADWYLALWFDLHARLAGLVAIVAACTAPLLLTTAAARKELDRTEGRLGWLSPASLVGAAAAFVLVLGLVAPFVHMPGYLIVVVEEDSFVEHATFVAWLIAAAMLARALLKAPPQLKVGLAALAALSAFMAGEEVSWGQRILSIDTPPALRRVNLQGEINLHNLVEIAEFEHAAVGVCLLAWLAFSRRTRGRASDRTASALGGRIPTVPDPAEPAVLAAAVALLLTPWRTLYRIDEVGEFLLAASLAAVAIFHAVEPGVSRIRKPVIHLRVLLGTAAWGTLVVVALLLVRGPEPSGLLKRSAVLELPCRGLDRQAVQVLEYLGRHPDLEDSTFMVAAGAELIRQGRTELGHRYLEDGLASLEPLDGRDATDLEIGRLRYVALRSLGRADEADVELARTLRAAVERLASNPDRAAAAEVHVALARLFMAAGDTAIAVAHAGKACTTTDHRELRRRLRTWLRCQLGNTPPVCRN